MDKARRKGVALKAWDGSLDCDAAFSAIRDVMAGAA
jgi:hypothetical protein